MAWINCGLDQGMKVRILLHSSELIAWINSGLDHSGLYCVMKTIELVQLTKMFK